MLTMADDKLKSLLRRSKRPLAILAGLCFLTGCSSGDVGVAFTGAVTFKGQPVEHGEILFLSESGRQFAAPIRNGAYQVPMDYGVAEGRYEVRIEAMRKSGARRIATAADLAYKEGEVIEEYEQFIPRKYNDATQLSLKVVSEKNQYDFSLAEE